MAGVAASAWLTSKTAPKVSFHRHERGRHAGRALKAHGRRLMPYLARQLLAHVEQACLDFSLLVALRGGNILIAGDDLRRDRGGVGEQFCRHQAIELVLAQEADGENLPRLVSEKCSCRHRDGR